MDKPTFAQRTAAMKDAAEQLKACTDIVIAEAERMDAAQQRFAQRVGNRTGARQRKTA